MKHKIIIVGGGMSGIGCAHRLLDNGHSFKMITENIGGRVKTSPDGKWNYGAYYMNKDYKWIMPFVDIGGKLKISDVCFRNGKDSYRFYSLRILKHIPALLRLRRDAFRYREKFLLYNALAVDHDRKEIVENDPIMKHYVHQKAEDYIRERKLDALVEEYLRPLLWGIGFFGDCRKVTTAVFLGVMLLLLNSPRTFRMRFDKMIERFKDDIIFDSVVSVKHNGKLYELTTKSGQQYTCEKLVMATPMNITNTLVSPQKINAGFDVSYYHVTGKLKEPYNKVMFNIFPIEEHTLVGELDDGTSFYYYSGEDQIDKYFDSWKVITHDRWEPCLFFLGDNFVNVHPEPDLFLATDHNAAGMESAYINGMYTAKLVMESMHKT